MHSIDLLASRLARRQEGVFSREQLLRNHVSASAIDRRLRAGRWIAVAPGVYVLPSHPGTWLRQAWIAVLAHPGGAIGLDSAAYVRGCEGFGQVPIQLVLPPGSNNRSTVASIHRYDGALVSPVRGLPVTTLAQTYADLCGTRSARKVEPAMDRDLLAGRLTHADLDERKRFYLGTRRHGRGYFEALVDERGGEAFVPSESVVGDGLRRLVRRLRITDVRWQPSLPWRPATGERLDALFPGPKVVLEGDGRAWHGRLRDFDRDRWRDNEAAAHGYQVLRFTWVHLEHRFEECVGLAADVIASRLRPAS